MGRWIKAEQELPIKNTKVEFRTHYGLEYTGKYDGLVFRDRDYKRFWHSLEIKEWRYVYE